MERLSNFLRGTNKLKQQEITLPSRFAQQVLDLQLEVESNPQVDIEVINRLIELYSIAVEYYESIKSNKYVVFKNKITKLLLSPSINRTMENNTKDAIIFGDDPSHRVTNQMRKKELQHTLTYATQNTEGQVRTIMITANDRFDNVSKIINTGLIVQEYEIRERLKRRKKNKQDPISRDSTESDPREPQDETECDQQKEFLLGTCSEPIEQIPQSAEKQVDMHTPTTQVEKEQKKPQQQIQSPEKSLQKQAQTKQQKILTPEEIFMMKLQRIEKKKKRKLLTLKTNQKPEKLPEEYSIPF